jgi:hypothetical protein
MVCRNVPIRPRLWFHRPAIDPHRGIHASRWGADPQVCFAFVLAAGRAPPALQSPEPDQLTGRGDGMGCGLHRQVRVGSRVRLLDQYGEVEFLIVSTERSDGSGTLSVHSPLGAALLHRRVGERLTVRTPFGFHFVAILSVDRADHAPEPGVDP